MRWAVLGNQKVQPWRELGQQNQAAEVVRRLPDDRALGKKTDYECCCVDNDACESTDTDAEQCDDSQNSDVVGCGRDKGILALETRFDEPSLKPSQTQCIPKMFV